MFRSLAITLALFAASGFASPVSSNTTDFDVVKREGPTRWGTATWFNAGLGHCGQWNNNGDKIIALPSQLYTSKGEGGFCDQWVEVKHRENGKRVYARVRDSCPTCPGDNIDLSPAAFNALDNPDRGMIPVEWRIMDRGFNP